ncbi:uncharacterized protein FOMMEDRAFT_134950 [Fomitiporia mediterranea MF3/22]|uniref:uncharacterized protein n=1 Tax=Fomitiporia mediterranea (strain MF3/22) TaxID=694068 RepID=UPI0004409555|nr:uncharacterized protein FOMMEDRAFT_134950 [Fomitiporia mediterranea MF3/22]EJD02427.1 hypothetical protein FOMMEDRAFT_134950 [Fomitiporia mediterranea MF3/22]
MKKLGKMKRMIRGTGNPKSSSDDDDDDDESSASRERKDASKQGAETKSALKKRKTIIESDEDRDAEGSSHDGSLFSGDDEPEPEPVPVSEPAIQPNSAAEVAPAAQDSTDKPKEASVAPTPQDTAQKKEEPKRRQYRKAPKVVTMEDPNVKKSIEARVHGRAHEESGIFRQSSTSSGDASISPVENRGGWLVGSSSQPVRAEGGSYKPTLLTFEKGKLTSHRGSAAREASSPATPSGSGSAGTIPGSQVGGTMDAVAQRDTLWGESVQESNAMDTSSDFAPPIAPSATVLSRSSTEVITLEPVSNEPPPTAEELLRLSGASGAALDLPDFQAGEDTNGSIINSTAATTSTLMSMPSTSEQPSGVPAPQNTWKSSSIFGLPSSSSSFSFFEKILPSSPTRHAQPAKLTIPLRLDPISSVPIILKDVTQPSLGQKLTDLLAQGQDGPPGKLFEPDVINSCVTAGNSAARVVPDEGVSDEQRAWFSKLIDELDKGVLFIVALGANSFALCSSNNHYVAQKLNVPSSLIGLSRTVIMQHITITDSTLYMTYAVLAVDLKLR